MGSRKTSVGSLIIMTQIIIMPGETKENNIGGKNLPFSYLHTVKSRREKIRFRLSTRSGSAYGLLR